MLGCDERLVRRWGAGSVSVPVGIAEWIERLATFHEANPPPSDWRQRAEASERTIDDALEAAGNAGDRIRQRSAEMEAKQRLGAHLTSHKIRL